jgi:hypothetical protein
MKTTDPLVSALRFVKGAIHESDLVPVMGSIKIERGFASAFNGEMRLTAAIPLEIKGTPNGLTFLKAIHKIDTVKSISEKGGKWVVSGGRTKITVPIIEQENACGHNWVAPSGEITSLTPETGAALIAACKCLAPLISKDASRPWAQSMWLGQGLARVTNNVIFAEYWLDFPFRDYEILLPLPAVNELARIGEPPSHVQLSETTLTFHWRGQERYLLTQTCATPWPDVSALFEKISWGASTSAESTPQLWEGLDTCVEFTTAPMHEAVWTYDKLEGGDAEVSKIESQAPERVKFNAKMLRLVGPLICNKGQLFVENNIIGFRGDLCRGVMTTIREQP